LCLKAGAASAAADPVPDCTASPLASLQETIATGPQFTLLADIRHGNMERREFLASAEFAQALACAGVKKFFIEAPRSGQRLINRLFDEKQLPQFIRNLNAEGGFNDIKPEDRDRAAKLYGQLIINLKRNNIFVVLYDFTDPFMTGQSVPGEARSSHFRCFADPRYRPQMTYEEIRQFMPRAIFTERLLNDNKSAALIAYLAADDKSVVYPGSNHVSTARGLDDNLRAKGVQVIKLFADQREFEGHPDENIITAKELAIELNQRPDFYYLISARAFIRPEPQWLARNDEAVAGAWEGPRCRAGEIIRQTSLDRIRYTGPSLYEMLKAE
jgi:hypothetical protein